MQGKEKTQWMTIVSEEGEMQPRDLRNDSLGRPNISLSGSNMLLGQGEELLEVYIDASGTVLKHRRVW